MLIAILIALQIADIATTYLALTRAGAREANPVVAWFIARLGLLPGLIIAKIVLVVPVIALGAKMPAVLISGIALYAAVIVNNLIVVRRAMNKKSA